MRIVAATQPGNPGSPNEDWVSAAQSLIVVLDGSTARTETGCTHGVAWYAAKLGSAITSNATEPSNKLADVLAAAIAHTDAQHPQCDLSHVGTPSAMVAIVRIGEALDYLVLGDTTIVVDSWDRFNVLTDERVSTTAVAERAEADQFPFGSLQKQAALLRMKHAELAQRNQPGGFWIAAADPTVAEHAVSGSIPKQELRRLAVLTDGAARITSVFGLLDWHGVMELLDDSGPVELIQRVRALETADPDGTRWPRNKPSDDATAVLAIT